MIDSGSKNQAAGGATPSGTPGPSGTPDPSGAPAAAGPASVDAIAGLAEREPIFHRRAFIWDADSFDAQVAPDYREVGASGLEYSRDVVRDVVLKRLAGYNPSSLVGGYRVQDVDVTLLAPGVAQVLYTLHGSARVTRRSTIYRANGDDWQAVFHQGTVLPGESPLSPDTEEP